MRILLLSDVESRYLWDFFDKSKLDGIDLIISCGDLAPHYLSFLATFAKVPILYIHGNHDTCYLETPPEGCICIDNQMYVYEGIRILGIGGCMKYDGREAFQFTDKEMDAKIKKLKSKIKKCGGIDILVTHSPAFQVNDGDDLPHMGFKGFRDLLENYNPVIHAHGHMHINYGIEVRREIMYNNTRIVNAYERYVIEI